MSYLTSGVLIIADEAVQASSTGPSPFTGVPIAGCALSLLGGSSGNVSKSLGIW